MKLKLVTLAVVAGSLLVPSAASATDADIQNIIRDGATKIAAAESRAQKASDAFEKKVTPKTIKRFREAARAEKVIVDEIAAALAAAQPDTPNVGQGRDLIVKGLKAVGTGLGRIDKAVGQAKSRAKAKTAKRNLRRAVKEIEEGNALIEEGEPLAGAELTPKS